MLSSRGDAGAVFYCRLRFGKMVDKVIPYLPMDPASNLLVVELKLQNLAETLDGGLYTTSGECPHEAVGWAGVTASGQGDGRRRAAGQPADGAVSRHSLAPSIFGVSPFPFFGECSKKYLVSPPRRFRKYIDTWLVMRCVAEPEVCRCLLDAGLRWHLVQPQYIQYSSYHVTLAIDGREEVIRHQLAAYGARDVEKVREGRGAELNSSLSGSYAANVFC